MAKQAKQEDAKVKKKKGKKGKKEKIFCPMCGEKGKDLYDVNIQSCFDERKLYRLDMQLKSFDDWEGFNVNLQDLVERYDVSSREW